VKRHIQPKIEEATLVTFAGAELVQRENALLPKPLIIEKV